MQVLSLSLPFFGLILLGYVSARLKPMSQEGLKWMNFFIIYISLPALFFQLIRKTPLEQLANSRFILAATGCTILVFCLGFLAARWLCKHRQQEATLMGVASSYSNIGYMGPGLTLAAFGEAAVVPTALIFCFDNAFLFVITPLLIALSAQGETQLSQLISKALKEVLLHPFILATMAGIAASAIALPVPSAVDNMLNLLKGAAAPCALFAMGVVIASRRAQGGKADVFLSLFLKLLIHPALIWFTMQWFGGFEPIWVYTAVLMAALPPAMNIFVLAQHYDAFVNQASTVVWLGTLIAVGSVTALLWAIKIGWLV